MTLADSIFKTAVLQAKAERDRIVAHVYNPREVTPIIRDMRETARSLGIVDALLEHQRVVYAEPATCYDLVEECLIALGVTNAELLANLTQAIQANGSQISR